MSLQLCLPDNLVQQRLAFRHGLKRSFGGSLVEEVNLKYPSVDGGGQNHPFGTGTSFESPFNTL